MGKRYTNKNRTTPAWAGLAMAVALLGLSLALLAGTVAAAGSQGPPPQINLAQRERPAAPEGDGVWTPLGGPIGKGGQVNALAVHPTISGTTYAAVQALGTNWSVPAVIYQSTDGAANWTAIYTTANRIASLETCSALVYAGAYSLDDATLRPLIYRSTDGGLNWTVPLSLSSGTIWDLDIDPTNTQVAIAGGGDYPDKASLYRTADGGATWSEIFSYTMPGWYPTVNAVLIHPTTPLTWLLSYDGEVNGNWGSYFYRSIDGGANWTKVYTITDDSVHSLIVNSTSPNTLYAGTTLYNFYRSTDGGATWTAVITDGSAGEWLVFDPPDNALYAGAGGEVRKSTDGGDSWSTVSGLPGNLRALAIDLGPTPGALYAGLDNGGGGIYKSTDGGANWAERNNNIENPLPPRDIDLDPSNPGKMFAATECTGGWLSTDGGWNWTRIEEACMGAYAINPENPDIVYGGEYNCGRGPVRRSEDGGFTFRSVFTPTFIISDCSGGDETIFDLAIAPSMSSTVYAVGADHPNWSGDQAVAVRSLDDGASWTVVFTLPEWSQIGVVTIDPTDADVVYLGGEACDPFGCEGFVYRSTDAGASWTLVLTDPHSIGSVVVDYQKPNVLYAAAKGPYDVYKSTDAGDSWTLIRSNNPPFNAASGYLLTIDPHAPSHVTLGGWGYIAETPDGGQTWIDWPLNNGTPQMEPTALVVDTGSPTQTLYAGFSGVWAYSRPAPQPGEAMTIHMYTDPFTNPLYANGLNSVSYYAYPLDEYENWTAPGTPVSVTYEWLFGDWNGQLQIVKYTNDDGYIRGGWMGISAEGVVTFTAQANVTATAMVTMAFIYNPPAGITAEATLDSATTAIVSATMPGLHDGVASDGTEVNFETSLGTIDATALTVRGVATATLTSGGAGGVAVITATVDGFSDVTTVDFGLYRIYLPIVVKND